MPRQTLFVDVLLPLHLPDTFTYRLPEEYNEAIAIGQRVVVQFGAKRLYSALVRRIHSEVPSYPTKYILAILDIQPIVSPIQFRFWDWMAEYYMCYPGDVMAVALPTAFRLSSESFIRIHPDFSGEYNDLNENEISVLDILSRKERIPVADVAQIVGFQKIMPLVKTMIEKRVVVMEEELSQRFTPKTSTWLTLADNYRGEEALHRLLDSLQKPRTEKQLLGLLKFLQLSKMGLEEIRKRDLASCSDISQSAINTLISKQIILPVKRAESRLDSYASLSSADSIQLNDEQQKAFDVISASDKPVNLLHGVTSSGKTEVYIKLIDKALKNGGQVLFLLPEIALTAQIINRLRRYFGDRVGVYHSRFNAQERAEVWTRTLDTSDNGYRLLVGARSALFLPFHRLDLVIVDEEHDASFKQVDPAPRYQGRDSAVYLAHIWNARTVLGSATPSIESFFNARNGKYGYAQITRRYGGVQMPEVLCVDMRLAQQRKEVHQNFSDFLIRHIRTALENKQQVILFQNRRGFSLRLECDTCHSVPQCKHCDVSLVYHKATNSLRCHYCGYAIPVPQECPACHSTALKMRGFGTERIEDDISILFPDARIARMDLDATSQKNRYLEILSDFEEHKIDILVGTQMVTKGLDFRNVSVVGILSADNLISYPDFRAYERSFQQMTQVSGRAGRQGDQGTVIIQTFQPYHQAIRDAMDNNYLSMYESQITERRVFRYPPYFKLIVITLKHRESQTLDMAAARLADQLRQLFANRVMGPEYPNVARIRNLYLKKIMLRFDRNEPVSAAKKEIIRLANLLTQDKAFSRLTLQFDVDPQ